MTEREELIEGLKESYKLDEELYDRNLERMAELHDQIEALKANNTSIMNRMRKLAEKIRVVDPI